MNKVFRKDVTDEEIARAMAPVLHELKSFLVPRKEPSQEKREDNANKEKPQEKKPIHISEEARDYLKSIVEHPNLSVTARGEKLFAFSADKRTRMKNDLLKKGLIEEFSVDLGITCGGRVKLLRLTRRGYELIGKKPPLEPSGVLKKASCEHIWWQEFIAKDYRARGYKAVIEKELNGKSADIGVMTDHETVAVEVELTPRNALTNFKENIDAGFTRTLIACKNYRVKKEVEKKLSSFFKEHPAYEGKAKVVLLTDFPFVKNVIDEIRGN